MWCALHCTAIIREITTWTRQILEKRGNICQEIQTLGDVTRRKLGKLERITSFRGCKFVTRKWKKMAKVQGRPYYFQGLNSTRFFPWRAIFYLEIQSNAGLSWKDHQYYLLLSKVSFLCPAFGCIRPVSHTSSNERRMCLYRSIRFGRKKPKSNKFEHYRLNDDVCCNK